MTDRIKKGQNRGKKNTKVPEEHFDPRIVELVHFLARRAAEHDFAEMLRQSEESKPPGTERTDS